MIEDRLDLVSATTIIGLAVRRAEELAVPPLTVVVLDEAGYLIAMQRQDGATMFRFDVAVGKAWGAVAMGCSSRDLAARAADNPNFFGALASVAHGRLLPQPGAVLVRRADGSVLGSVGASGGTGEEDEECCVFGVRGAGFVTDLRRVGA